MSQGYSPIPTDPFAGGESSPGVFRGTWEIPRLRVAGNAPVVVHWSVLILLVIYGVIAYTSGWLLGVWRIPFAVLSPIFLLLSIFLHEWFHATAYFRIYKMWVKGIYLYALGGLTVAGVNPEQSASKTMQIVVAVAGPLANALLGGILIGAAYIYAALASTVLAELFFVLFFLGITQMALAVYNMIPGVPLDGSAFLVGLMKCCMVESTAKKVSYTIGVVVIVGLIVVVCIFLSLWAGLFLIFVLFSTAWALLDVAKPGWW